MSNSTKILFHNAEYELIKVHQDQLIVKCPEGIISVIDPEIGSFFVVALDDSKLSGKRCFDDSANTVENAIKHINSTLVKCYFSEDDDTIRTESHLRVCEYTGSTWVLNPMPKVPETILIAFAKALRNHRHLCCKPDGTALINQALP